MAGKKRAAATSGSSRRTTRSAASRHEVPEVYREMLAEAEVRPAAESPERPTKRRRPGQRNDDRSQKPTATIVEKKVEKEESEEDDDDIEFEDVQLPVAAVQTIERDTDEEDDDDDDDDVAFENVDLSSLDIDSAPVQDSQKYLELDLSAHTTATPRKVIDRRKPISKAEKDRRVEIHKTHLLCLLAHVSRRNRWCNDPSVQKALRPLLTKKMVTYLNPNKSLSQFGQTQSLKNGLQDAMSMFKLRFQITERGLRRALWAENEEYLKSVNFPSLLCIMGGN